MKTIFCNVGLILANVGLFAGSATWNVDANGNWSDEKNWSQITGINAIYPNGKTDVATFPPFKLTKPRTITVNGTYDISALNFNSEQKYTLTSGQLNIWDSICVTGKAEIQTLLMLQNTISIMANDSFKISGNIAGVKCSPCENVGIIKQGEGTLTLTGMSTYCGMTTIQSGVLQAGGVNVFSPTSAVVMANTTGVVFDLNNHDNKIANINGAGPQGGNTLLGSATLTVGDENHGSYAGSIFGTGSVTKVGSGTLTICGLNSTYSGVTRIQEGTLQAAQNNVFSPNSSIVIANRAGVCLDLNGYTNHIPNVSGGGILGGDVSLGCGTLILDDNTSTVFSGSISGKGGITKNGTGVFTLERMSTYTGPTLISAGTLNLKGVLTSPTTISNGAFLTGNGMIVGNVMVSGANKPERMTVVGNYTQGQGSVLEIQLIPGVRDCLVTTGCFTIQDDVTLNITAPSDYAPGTSFEIISAGGGIQGLFAKINFPDKFKVISSSHNIVIEVR